MNDKLKELRTNDPKKFWVYVTCIIISLITVVLCVVVAVTAEPGTNESDHENANTEEVTDTNITSDWKTAFSANGFTEDEISEYEEILTNVGITDYHDIEIIENGIMHIVKGKIYDSKLLQLNMTLENRHIIVITLSGIPDDESTAYINWRGELKFKKEQTKKSIDLYYDVDGGYVAKLDWENMIITPYIEE